LQVADDGPFAVAGYRYHVTCGGCFAKGPMTRERSKAIAEWNERDGFSLQPTSYRLERYVSVAEYGELAPWIELRLQTSCLGQDRWIIARQDTYLDDKPLEDGTYAFALYNPGIMTWESAGAARAWWTANRQRIIATAAEQRAYFKSHQGDAE